MSTRINIGCGQTPTPGWTNYDNSWSVRLAKTAWLSKVLDRLGVLLPQQKDFIKFARTSEIKWANAAKRIPEADKSVEVLYSSDMLEHLDPAEAQDFLKEARRVLMHGGIIRIVVPDIQRMVKKYIENHDADEFIKSTSLTRKKPKTLIEKLKHVLLGDRNHQWMYDSNSLCRLLLSAGFKKPLVVEAGSTTIPNPGRLNLQERADESMSVETTNP